MPNLLTLLAISVSLAMDALAVSISTSVFLGDISKRQAFRIYFHFGLFQALYPVIGWLAGNTISAHLLGWNKIIAFVLLLGVGIKMIWDAVLEGEETQQKDPTRGILLMALSTSVSIDALAFPNTGSTYQYSPNSSNTSAWDRLASSQSYHTRPEA